MSAPRPFLFAPAAAALAVALGCGAAGAADTPVATTPAPTPPVATPAAASAPVAAGSAAASAVRPARARAPAAAKPESQPPWNALTPAQQQALGPLSASWSTLSQAHKRKWLAVSANYPAMPAAERSLLHSRMAAWAALSPQQRIRARQSFFEAQALPRDDKKAKWEAYQALPPEEKRRLAGAAATKPVAPATAAAVQPVPQQKLATVPRQDRADRQRTPRIAGTPGQVDHNTLLPQPGTVSAPP